jgi:alpha-beta hydrolase superfamily lysophospholipase
LLARVLLEKDGGKERAVGLASARWSPEGGEASEGQPTSAYRTTTTQTIFYQLTIITSMTSKPVIVIVSGAWHVPAHYAHLALKLNSAGYTVDCLELSCTNDEKDLPENTWTEDISIIRNAITSHTEAGRDVAVVMHSFGGMATSEAACGLGEKANETSGRVVKLIYMTSFMILEGQQRSDFPEWPNIARVDDEKVCKSHPLLLRAEPMIPITEPQGSYSTGAYALLLLRCTRTDGTACN